MLFLLVIIHHVISYQCVFGVLYEYTYMSMHLSVCADV